jgi:acetyl esterase/lipase
LEKLIVYSDSTGCAITFEIIKYAEKNKIRLPDSIILMHPNCNVSIDDLLYSNDPHYLEDVFEPLHRSRYNTNIYLDTIKDEERLNLFLIENKVLQYFPKTLVISAENEFLFDDCSKLVSFLKSHNVQVETRHLIYYSEGHFYFPSYLDSEFIVSLNFIYNYIKQELRKN